MTKEEKLIKLQQIEHKLKNIIDKFGILHYNFINYMNLIYLLDAKAGNLFDNIQDYVISTDDASNIYFFARDVEGCDIQKFEDAIMATGNIHFILKFADLKGANKNKLYAAAEELEKSAKNFENNAKNNRKNNDYDDFDDLISPLDEL